MSKPEAVETADAFFAVLKKSKLVGAEQIDQARGAIEKAASAQDVARSLIKRGWITKWQARQLLAGWYGLKIGKYTLMDQLGKDWMGRLFLADHAQLGRRALIKTLSSRHADRPEVVERFLAEASKAAALDHQNIVQVYDVCREADRHYLVLEYVDGRNLQAIVEEEGPLTSAAAANYIAQAAGGLSHAHDHGMVHRSLSPMALLVDDRDVVKIVGLGVGRPGDSAVSGGDDSDPEPTGDASHYLAPEQIGGRGPIDHRADIYALGCTMCFLLTGSSPPGPDRPEAPIPGEENTGVAALLANRSDVPPELAAICRKMTAIPPSSRYQTSEEVCRLLNKWLISQPPSEASQAVRHPTADAAEGALVEPGAPAASTAAVEQQPSGDEPTSGGPRNQTAAGLRRSLGPKSLLAIAAVMVLALLLVLMISLFQFR